MLTTPVQPITGTCTRGTRVSPSPSKIPYGGFSPVRLQTGIPPRPSPARSGSSLHPAPAYTRLKSLSRKRATSRSGTFVQAALPPSDRTLPSRGPWLASGLCCPAGSSLVGSEEARLRAGLRPPLKLHVRFSRMQLSRRHLRRRRKPRATTEWTLRHAPQVDPGRQYPRTVMYGFFAKRTDPPHRPYSSGCPSRPSCLRPPPSPTHSGRRSLGHAVFTALQVLLSGPSTG